MFNWSVFEPEWGWFLGGGYWAVDGRGYDWGVLLAALEPDIWTLVLA